MRQVEYNHHGEDGRNPNLLSRTLTLVCVTAYKRSHTDSNSPFSWPVPPFQFVLNLLANAAVEAVVGINLSLKHLE